VLIDPFTVIAQLVNFAVLLVALKLVLFDRIVRAMDEREAAIAGRVREANDRVRVADDRAATLQERIDELDRMRETFLAEGREEARQQRDELTTEVQQEVAEQRVRWQRALAREGDRAVDELRREVGEQVVGLTGQVLRDLADTNLESRVVDAFLRRLDHLDDTERSTFESWLASNQPVTVVSAFGLAAEDRRRVGDGLGRLAGTDVEVTFEQDPELVCGIELRAGGEAFGWTVDDYLDRFAQTMRPLLHREHEAGNGPVDAARG